MKIWEGAYEIGSDKVSGLEDGIPRLGQGASWEDLGTLQEGLEVLTANIRRNIEASRSRNPALIKGGRGEVKAHWSTREHMFPRDMTIRTSELKVSQVKIMGGLRKKQVEFDRLLSTLEGYRRRNQAVDAKRGLIADRIQQDY